MHFDNIYDSIKKNLDSGAMQGSTRIGQMPQVLAQDFKLPRQRGAFAVKILNQNNQTIFEKIFDSEAKFKIFADKCTGQAESVGFFSISFSTARFNSIADFAKTFFFPTTTLCFASSSDYLFTLLWDLSTLFFRLVTLLFRFCEYQKTPQHPLLEELIKAGLNTNAPYLDVHFYATKHIGMQKRAEVRLGKRIFFARHIPNKRAYYCHHQSYSTASSSHFSVPQQQQATKYPNPKTIEEIHSRWKEKLFTTPTKEEARDFFDLPSDFFNLETDEQENLLNSQFRKKALIFHPDKSTGDEKCFQWAGRCRARLQPPSKAVILS